MEYNRHMMSDELRTFDMDLAETLLERDGVLPDSTEVVVGTVTLTLADQELLMDLLEDAFSTTTDAEEADHLSSLMGRVGNPDRT